jgi:DNA-binding NarL/FixJ family response regulator
MSIRVLIADDQELVRTGFRMILTAQPDIDVVAEANDGAEAVEHARRTRPDVILMDIRMPRLDGIEATQRILANPRTERSRVIVLTTFDVDEYVFNALAAGASGFLLKDGPADELLRAIRVAAAGESILSPAITTKVVRRYARQPGIKRDPRLDELTPRELEILELLARGLSNPEIAERLIIGESTVKTHVARVLMKLGIRDRVQAVIAAYESGIIEPGEQSPP